jgi:hypothetical protein
MIGLIAGMSFSVICFLLVAIYLKLQDIQNEVFHNTQELKKHKP